MGFRWAGGCGERHLLGRDSVQSGTSLQTFQGKVLRLEDRQVGRIKIGPGVKQPRREADHSSPTTEEPSWRSAQLAMRRDLTLHINTRLLVVMEMSVLP
jgi:hypothetical protein